MAFKFINITNPEQARHKDILKDVRQFVQNPGTKKKTAGDAIYMTAAQNASVKKRRRKSVSPENRPISRSASATSSVMSKRSKTGVSDTSSLIAMNGGAMSYSSALLPVQSNTSSPGFYLSEGESFGVISGNDMSWDAASDSNITLSPFNFPNTPSPLLCNLHPANGTGLSTPLMNGISGLNGSMFPSVSPKIRPLPSTLSIDGFSGPETTSFVPAFHSHMPQVSPAGSLDLSPSSQYATFATELESPPLYFPVGEGHFYDPFDVLPKAFLLNMETVLRLKYNCIYWFGSASLKDHWMRNVLNHRIFFLSTLCISADHENMLVNRHTSNNTNLLRVEVTTLLQEQMNELQHKTNDWRGETAVATKELADCTAAALAHIGFAGNYTADDEALENNYDLLKSIVTGQGGWQNFDKFVRGTMVMVTLESAIFRNMELDEVFLQGADLILAHKDRHRETNRITRPKLESPICYNPLTGFSKYLQTSAQCTPQLLELLEEMKQLGESISYDTTDRPSLNDYSVQREAVRRYISELPSAKDSGDYVYEACRITAIIFERACYNRQPLFLAIVGTTLVSQLKDALEKSKYDEGWGEHMTGVLFWAAMIGASAARHSEERKWFVGVVTRVTIKHAFDTGIWIIAALRRLWHIQKWLNSGFSTTSGVFDMDDLSAIQTMLPMEPTPSMGMNFGTEMNMMDYTNQIF